MKLKSKTLESGGSIVVEIPEEITKIHNLSIGEKIQVIPIKDGEIRIKKIKTTKASTSS